MKCPKIPTLECQLNCPFSSCKKEDLLSQVDLEVSKSIDKQAVSLNQTKHYRYKEYNREWKRKNAERVREYNKKYREEHKQYYYDYQKRYVPNYSEIKRLKDRQYYMQNRELILEKQRKKYAKNQKKRRNEEKSV